MKKVFSLLAIVAVMMASCMQNAETEKLTVASIQADCTGVGPMKCLLVKVDEQPDWQYFYNSIEGFNYEPGYEYVIEVKKEKIENPAADQSSIKYTLVKQISKDKKHSENLPDHLDF